MSKILVVEDDAELLKKVSDWLAFEKHSVESAGDGREALEKLQFFGYDLIILDWALPELSGIQVLKEFRDSGGTTPVLILTGKDTIADKEKGLDTGADDYLTKPFDLRELSARVRAMVRKSSGVYSPCLRVRSLELDTTQHRVTVNGKEVKLQPMEFALLEFLLRHPSDIFSIDSLLQRIWPSDSEASIDTVRVCITRLRNKIDTPGTPSLIRTVHKLGYQIDQGTDE